MPESKGTKSTNKSVHPAQTCENTVMNKPIVAWKACENRFVWMSDFGHEGAFHLTHEHALRHWQDGTALFLENAQRVVSQLAVDAGV